VVQKSNIKSQAEIHFSSLMLSSPSNFFQYPLSCILGTSIPSMEDEQKMTGLSYIVEKLLDRKKILSDIEAYVKTLTSSPALLNDVLTVIDETLTNAVYNAPFVSENAASPSREIVDFPIDPVKRPFLFVGHDAERIIVGCRDSYGSLNVDSLIIRIKTCYESNVSEMINFGEGGAGIGSFLMFNSCASMYIGVDSGLSTTVCCSFPFKLSATSRSEMPKNIHLIHR
ncbi:MAG: hypothetical protein ACXWC9_10205, partial [Pseudobdellovibrionaceae bacterium]